MTDDKYTVGSTRFDAYPAHEKLKVNIERTGKSNIFGSEIYFDDLINEFFNLKKHHAKLQTFTNTLVDQLGQERDDNARLRNALIVIAMGDPMLPQVSPLPTYKQLETWLYEACNSRNSKLAVAQQALKSKDGV